jgi:hypothetical protein
MPLWRGQRKYTYHTCARCGFRQPLQKMIWQNGILVCSVSSCIDKAIVGSRDINVARAVSVYRHELEPDVKLTNPTDRRVDQNDILY